MLSKSEIVILNEQIAELLLIGHVDEAVALVREKPLIFCHLPEELRDNESFALIAMSRLLQVGGWASSRLKKNIDFFIQAFNAHFSIYPISLSSARDTIFMLEFSRIYFHYRHDITESEVVEKFSCSEQDAIKEIESANRLIGLAKHYEPWLTYDKIHDIEHLAMQAPGFTSYSYEYAFMWSFGTQSARIASEYR